MGLVQLYFWTESIKRIWPRVKCEEVHTLQEFYHAIFLSLFSQVEWRHILSKYEGIKYIRVI